jgi:PAS domain S-box-containing protein
MPERQKILIVDDREENLFALEKTLRETEAEIIKATSGDEALAAALHHDFALAILDVLMPGMSGFELANHLRRDEKTQALPIIFLTASFADEEHAFKGYEAGAVDYIIKPFNPVILNGKARAFLELARYRKQLEDMVQERTAGLRNVNQILRKVRHVNQLIVREQDEKRLIREACKLLVEARGFVGAWIAVVDGSENLVDIAQDGFGDSFSLFTESLRSGALPPCCKEAQQQRGVIVTHNLEENCGDCPLRLCYGGNHAMITILEHEGAIRGFLGLAVPAAMAVDKEEQSLFQEVAGDIAYALHNIELRKEREVVTQALKESEERHRAIFDNASVGIDLVNRQGRFLEVNNTLSKFLGYTPGELEHLTMFDVTHPEDASRSKEMHETLVQGETGSYRFEKRYVRKDGSVFWADTAVSAIRGADGQYRATVGVIRDISQRKKSQEARTRLAAAVEQAAESVEITDPQGTIVYVNPAFARTTGYSLEEALGNNPRILKSGNHDEKFYKRMWKTLTDGKPWTGHFINKKKDGTLFEEDVSISPVKDDSGKLVNYVAVKRDVTKEVSLQKQLLQAQKMEAIGTLTGGIAHDFNNLLQVTLGYSELLLTEKSEKDRDYADLQKICQASRSGAELVRSLLTFSRKVEPLPVPINLNNQVQHTEKLLRRTIPRMINIRLELSEDLARTNADPGQIEQVIMNLSVNARDAMGEDGTLTIRTENVTLDEEYCQLNVEAQPGDYVLLSVADTGSGMDPETLTHIFEPFYTTKELGKGTGLGLAIVYGIVKQHGGHITCYSEVGKGTTFRVCLPAIESQVEPEVDKTAVMPAFGTETLLLVDDEDPLRVLGERILTKSGYTVLIAANGEEALALYNEKKEQISLVILDLVMPTMGGKDCLHELLKIDPAVKVLIASGYAGEETTKECVRLGAKGFVSKPFKMKELLQQVRKVLDES